MATVAALIDRVCRIARMDITAASAERGYALEFLQQAYDEIAADLQIKYPASSTAALTSGTASYLLNASPFNVSGFLGFDDIWISAGATLNLLLERKPIKEIRRARTGAVVSGDPVWYDILGDTTIELYPTPGTGVTLGYSYWSTPPILDDGGAGGAGHDTTPSMIPSPFHFRVLGTLATAIAFEYKAQYQPAQTWRGLHEQGLQALKDWLILQAGEPAAWIDTSQPAMQYPDVYAGGDW